MYWRVAITSPDNLADDVHFPHIVDYDTPLWYSTGGLTEFAGGEVTVSAGVAERSRCQAYATAAAKL